ncbi:MAG: SDR family oxidoreductase [Myxococcota bacterium]
MSSDTSLQDKTAIVTGASSGIGRAIALALGRQGARVYLQGRTQAPMDETAKQIEEAGGAASVVVLDVRDHDALRGLVDRAVADTGRLDIMVNNAGLSHPAPITEGDPEQWREMYEVNVLALLVGCQAAARAMRAGGRPGHIVNISSIAAQNRESGVYGSTKHAVNCLSASLRKELADDPIRVVTIMPGAIATNFARNFDPAVLKGIGQLAGVDMDPQRGDTLPDEVLEKVQAVLEQRLARAEDIADAVCYAVTAPIRVNVTELAVRPPGDVPL